MQSSEVAHAVPSITMVDQTRQWASPRLNVQDAKEGCFAACNKAFSDRNHSFPIAHRPTNHEDGLALQSPEHSLQPVHPPCPHQSQVHPVTHLRSGWPSSSYPRSPPTPSRCSSGPPPHSRQAGRGGSASGCGCAGSCGCASGPAQAGCTRGCGCRQASRSAAPQCSPPRSGCAGDPPRSRSLPGEGQQGGQERVGVR
jgi:hypothetical protein